MDFQVHCCGNFTPYFANGRSMGISQIAAEFMGEKQSDEDQVCLFNIVHVFRLQSLDYDVCYNKPFSKMLASRDKKVRMSDKIKLATDSFYWV